MSQIKSELEIIIKTALTTAHIQESLAEQLFGAIWNFVEVLRADPLVGAQVVFSVRDALAYADYLKAFLGNGLSPAIALEHSCRAVHLDSLGCSGYDLENDTVKSVQDKIGAELIKISMKLEGPHILTNDASELLTLRTGSMTISETFSYRTGSISPVTSGFCWSSPSTSKTLVKLGRAMMLNRPVILEGSPGVGKTSIVASLAAESGFPVTRINLSEQTDVSDLFGADLPVDGGMGGEFEWKDGPLLLALRTELIS